MNNCKEYGINGEKSIDRGGHMNLLFARVFDSYYDESLGAVLQHNHWNSKQITYFTPEDPYHDPKLFEMIRKDVEKYRFDVVFTVNFWPVVSQVCEKYNIPYIAWSYDSPQNLPNTDWMDKEHNYIYLFDRNEVKEYRELGVSRVFHMPLATFPDLFERKMILPKKRNLRSDVALVGSLYESQTYQSMLHAIGDENLKGWFDGIVKAQQLVYGYWMIPSLITSEIVERVRKETGRQDVTNRHISYMIAEYLTYIDRLMLLKCSKITTEDVAVYTWKNTAPKDAFTGIDIREPVDYLSEMPYVFQNTKINLCPTLRCISSGIPQRMLDVMACNGFLLTPVQEELLEYFVPNQDVAVYSNLEEAVDLERFYLTHDSERMNCIKNARAKIDAAFRMEDRFKTILEYSGVKI